MANKIQRKTQWRGSTSACRTASMFDLSSANTDFRGISREELAVRAPVCGSLIYTSTRVGGEFYRKLRFVWVPGCVLIRTSSTAFIQRGKKNVEELPEDVYPKILSPTGLSEVRVICKKWKENETDYRMYRLIFLSVRSA